MSAGWWNDKPVYFVDVKLLQKDADEMLDALIGLYRHTKNDMQICGLNVAAKEAIERATGSPIDEVMGEGNEDYLLDY